MCFSVFLISREITPPPKKNPPPNKTPEYSLGSIVLLDLKLNIKHRDCCGNEYLLADFLSCRCCQAQICVSLTYFQKSFCSQEILNKKTSFFNCQ